MTKGGKIKIYYENPKLCMYCGKIIEYDGNQRLVDINRRKFCSRQCNADYKRQDKISGIYCIENKMNHKKYIGQSININNRFSAHKSELRKGVHDNIHLQYAWNKYGEQSFEFYIIKKVDNIKDLDYYERHYIELFNTYKNGYNRDPGGSNNYKAKKPDEVIQKQINTVHNLSQEERENRYHNLVNAHLHESIPILQLSLEDGSIINEWISMRKAAHDLGYDQCCIWECVNHIRRTYKKYIWIKKEEFDSFDLANYKNKNSQPRKILQYDFEGNIVKEWDSANRASIDGFDPSSIIKCCKRKIKYHKGYVFKYKEIA